MDLESLRVMVDLRDRALQKSRIAFGNRLDAIEQERDTAGVETIALFQRWFDRMEALEKEANADLAEIAALYPIIEEAVQVKGCGFVNVAKVICRIDINRAATVSALWRYSGYDVYDDGRAARLIKGQLATFNKSLRVAVWLVGQSFMRSGSPYTKEYHGAREYYTLNRLDWTEGRRHNASLRKMVKLWLSHLWEAWRELEGLPVRPPYVIEYMKHTTVKSRFEYGWPER